MYMFQNLSWIMRGFQKRIPRIKWGHAVLSLFWKSKSRLMRSLSCLFVYVIPHQLLNAWTILHETWYIYHGTWSHLNCILHKSFPSVCVSVRVCVSLLSFPGNGSVKKRYRCNEYTRKNWEIVEGTVFYAVRVVSKESRRLVVCRFSCLFKYSESE
jgi:hypothetical protein